MRRPILLAPMLLACALTACGEAAGLEDDRPEGGASGGRDVERETLVVVEPLRIGPVRDEVVVSAKVASRASVSVFPKLSSLPVTKVAVEAGDRVDAGELLASLFDQDLQLAARSAEATHDETLRTVERNQIDLDQARQAVTSAERVAQKAAEDLARLAGLGDLATRQEVDDARMTADNAADDLRVAQFAERSAQITLELSRIAAQKADIAAQRARNDLAYTQIRSPIGGVVSQRNIELGELTSMSAPMFVVVDTEDLVLDLRVPQDSLGRLTAGQPVEARAVTMPDTLFHGRIRAVNPVLDETVGTVQVVVDLEPAPRLAPGLFCEARIITSARDDALLVSKRAVLYEDDQAVLFAVNGDDSARKIPFIAGASTATAVEILSDAEGVALSPDLRVVVVGQENLKDGAPVRIVEEAF
jgi:multidrug resistance efflux pump